VLPELGAGFEEIVEDWLDALARDAASPPEGRGRPLVTLAFARSADGCLSETRGEPTAISGEPAMRLTHELRARHAAILIGIETAISDDPKLTTRLVDGGETGLRIVLDSKLRLPVESVLLSADPKSPLIVATDGADESRARELGQKGAHVLTLPASPRGVSLDALLAHLLEAGIGSLMVEGGARIIESFLLEGVVDHVCVTSSPMVIDNPMAVRLSNDVERRVVGWMRAGGTLYGADLVVAGRLEDLERAAVTGLVP